MLRKSLTVGFLTLLLGTAIPASAQFMASDLIYLPGAAHTGGPNGAAWRSDLYITNVGDSPIDVAIVYLQTGLISNQSQFVDRTTWLGGREDDGFGFIDPLLADIPAGGTIVLEDPIGTYWVTELGYAESGAMVIFTYEADSLEDDGSRVFKDSIVNSRVFTRMTVIVPDPDNEDEVIEVEGTYGQTMPGVPWYSLVSPSNLSDQGDFTFQILTGAAASRNFRYNVGIVNASDPLTVITIAIQPFQGNGEPFLNESELPIIHSVVMPPASHVQYNDILNNLFGLEGPLNDVSIDVTFVAWSSGGDAPNPGFAAYGTFIDNRTNDPTAILPAYAFPLNEDALWPSEEAEPTSKAARAARRARRPLEIPSR
jgi:hypothetical protein